MPPRLPRLRALGLAALALCVAAPGAAQQQRVPGSRARLTPPPGYVVVPGFAGFVNEATGALLTVVEMERPGEPLPEMMAGMRRGMIEEALSAPGVTLRDTAWVRVNGTDGLWMDMVQDLNGVLLYRQTLMTADSRSVFIASATLPGTDDAGEAGRLRAAMMTLDWTDARDRDVFEGLPFRVDVPPALRGGQSLGDVLMLSEAAAYLPLPPGEALVMVLRGERTTPSSEAAQVVTDRVRRMARLSVLSGFRFTETEIGGRTAYEVTASATDTERGTPVRLYRVVLPLTRGYGLLVGIVGMDREAEWLPVFRALAASFREAAPGED